MTTKPQQRIKQLRGNALKIRIVDAIHEYASEQVDAIDPDNVSMKAIAAGVPCSRTTLLKYDDIVANTLKDIGLRLARRTGDARAGALSDRVDLLRKENDTLKAELAAMRVHHTKLYGLLFTSFEPMAALVKNDVAAILMRDGCCGLCGSEWPTGVPSNVVEFNKTERSPRKRQLKAPKK
jgi:hypothetical protein